MIADYLALFDKDSDNFKTLIYDPSGVENDPVNAIQDINKGAIHNSFEYTNRWKNRSLLERSLKTATSFLLDAWGELFGIPRNSEIDSEYRQFILDRIFPPQFTISWLRSVLPPEVSVKEANEIGFFLDDSFFDEPLSISETGCTLTALSNAIYITYNEATDIDWNFILYLGRIRPAGVAVYVGWTKSGIYEYLFLDDSFLNDSFISEQDESVLNPQNEPELSYLNQSNLDDAFIGE